MTAPPEAPLSSRDGTGGGHSQLDPALADALGTVRTGPHRAAVLRFAVEQGLLGLGAGGGDAGRVRAWYRRHWLREQAVRRGPLGALAAVLKAPARVVREAREAVRAHGAAVAESFGVPAWRQLGQLVRLALLAGIDADSYYRYWLYRPERRRDAARFLQWQEAAVLYRVLAAREAMDDFVVLEDKRRFAEWCAAHALPTVPVLAEFRDGALASSRAAPVLPARDLFSKPSDQYGGAGVRSWRHLGPGTSDWWSDEEGRAHDAAALLAALAEQSREGPVILQPRLTNEAVLAPLAPHALCTLRLLTARAPGGAPELVLATFRTGAGGSTSDNFTSGGIAVAVDLASGRLASGVRLDTRLVIAPAERHPDTGVPFAGFPVPRWHEAKTLALAAHARLRAMAFVGWDIAFTPDGLILLEGNFNPGVRIVQAGSGKPLGATPFLRYLDLHLRRSFAK